MIKFKKEKVGWLSHSWRNLRVLLWIRHSYSLYKGLIEVTLTVPLKDIIVENIVQVWWATEECPRNLSRYRTKNDRFKAIVWTSFWSLIAIHAVYPRLVLIYDFSNVFFSLQVDPPNLESQTKIKHSRETKFEVIWGHGVSEVMGFLSYDISFFLVGFDFLF